MLIIYKYKIEFCIKLLFQKFYFTTTEKFYRGSFYTSTRLQFHILNSVTISIEKNPTLLFEIIFDQK